MTLTSDLKVVELCKVTHELKGHTYVERMTFRPKNGTISHGCQDTAFDLLRLFVFFFGFKRARDRQGTTHNAAFYTEGREVTHTGVMYIFVFRPTVPLLSRSVLAGQQYAATEVG